MTNSVDVFTVTRTTGGLALRRCKLMPTLTFDLLTSNKICDQDLSCTIHLPSLVMISALFFVLECWHNTALCDILYKRLRNTLTYLLTYLHTHAQTYVQTYVQSGKTTKLNIGRRVVSIWHDRWQYLSRHFSIHSSSPNLLSAYLAMSSLVFQPSSCHLLGSIPKPD